jgi:hypothetical protein
MLIILTQQQNIAFIKLKHVSNLTAIILLTMLHSNTCQQLQVWWSGTAQALVSTTCGTSPVSTQRFHQLLTATQAVGVQGTTGAQECQGHWLQGIQGLQEQLERKV